MVTIMAKNTKHNTNNLIANGMGIPAYDYFANTWTDGKLTKTTYRLGGATGDIVAVIETTYSGSNVATVERTT